MYPNDTPIARVIRLDGDRARIDLHALEMLEARIAAAHADPSSVSVEVHVHLLCSWIMAAALMGITSKGAALMGAEMVWWRVFSLHMPMAMEGFDAWLADIDSARAMETLDALNEMEVIGVARTVRLALESLPDAARRLLEQDPNTRPCWRRIAGRAAKTLEALRESYLHAAEVEDLRGALIAYARKHGVGLRPLIARGVGILH